MAATEDTLPDIPELIMNTGAPIPQIGFGLWRNADRDECVDAVQFALDAGYVHFDDAQIYANEQYLGEAIANSGVDREELFITTKIWTENMEAELVAPSFAESLKKLRTDYVDLLLLHFPVTETRAEAWLELEKLHEAGKATAIGVSNYTVDHLTELLKACKVKPAVNQVELSVALQQPALVEYCKDNGIIVEAYTPLAEGHFFDDPTLKAIAAKHGKTVQQIMLRWCIDYGVVCLTKSANKERIEQNIDIFDFELDKDDMTQLKHLDQDHRTNWNPTDVE
ncbi:MAG TPA: aldo/keto reductase [Candidatus Saccharimonadales bacterium]|jgi:diketogulonate reductase-like aldo/keto reductase